MRSALWHRSPVRGRPESDPRLVEIAQSTVAAFGSFLLAEHYGMSAVLATLVAGLVVASVGLLGAITDRGRVAVNSFWECMAFASNSLVFLGFGMREAKEEFAPGVLPCMVAIIAVLAARALAAYGCCALFLASRCRVAYGHQHGLMWGGLRGALALALTPARLAPLCSPSLRSR